MGVLALSLLDLADVGGVVVEYILSSQGGLALVEIGNSTAGKVFAFLLLPETAKGGKTTFF